MLSPFRQHRQRILEAIGVPADVAKILPSEAADVLLSTTARCWRYNTREPEGGLVASPDRERLYAIAAWIYELQAIQRMPMEAVDAHIGSLAERLDLLATRVIPPVVTPAPTTQPPS